MQIIISQAQCCHQTGSNIKITLMIETEIGLRSMIKSRSTHADTHADASSLLNGSTGSSLGSHFRHSLRHHFLNHRSMNGSIHLLLDCIANRSCHRIIEKDRTVGLQPLLGEKATYCPMPEVSHCLVALQGEFLGKGILQLFL